MSFSFHQYSDENLQKIEKKLGIKFDDKDLLRMAITTKDAKEKKT